MRVANKVHHSPQCRLRHAHEKLLRIACHQTERSSYQKYSTESLHSERSFAC